MWAAYDDRRLFFILMVALMGVTWLTLRYPEYLALPTSMPLVMLFRRMTHRPPEHLRLMVLLIAGYFGVSGHCSVGSPTLWRSVRARGRREHLH